jgi:hypothetical protein
MCTAGMPSPEELREAPEMAVLTSLAYSLEAAQLALAASYPSLYDDSGLDDDHTEQSAYARGLYCQIDALLSLVDGYLTSAHRATSPSYRRRRSPGDVSF